jgi:hypothetical protein
VTFSSRAISTVRGVATTDYAQGARETVFAIAAKLRICVEISLALF